MALFDPKPLGAQAALTQQPGRFVETEAAGPLQTPDSVPPQLARGTQRPPAARKNEPAKSAVVKRRSTIAPHRTNRQRFSLDDAQIATIKRRLHLTPEQERMWPPVEVALRNIALARERAARRPGALAAIDANSAEVQQFKYAAMPLLMSFSDEQTDEARNLARAMGLDQLASEF
ncbi:MAG: hypothetical protein ACREH9_07205 [Pseudomonadota bacterium]